MKVFSEALTVDFGRPRNDQNLAPMAQDGRQDAPSWSPNAPKWDIDGHLESIWGGFLSIFRYLGSDFTEKGQRQKTDDSTTFLVYFEVFGGVVGGSWALFWPILATRWALLADGCDKLETSSQHVGKNVTSEFLREPTRVEKVSGRRRWARWLHIRMNPISPSPHPSPYSCGGLQ